MRRVAMASQEAAGTVRKANVAGWPGARMAAASG
jgi:hypothetical protein